LHIRKNGGFFEAESRLWTCYLAMPLYICGFLMLGAGIQNLNKAALIIGWGIATRIVMTASLVLPRRLTRLLILFLKAVVEPKPSRGFGLALAHGSA
ncbi:uncharacterized protein F5147DRAFT_673783, partial [Suillus discolor]